mgnify:CR=1 FL=1
MSAIEKAAAMLRREAESMKECHTVDVGGEWYGESAKAEYDEMIEVEAAAIAERGELIAALQEMVRTFAKNHAPAVDVARAAIARATGEQP